jgi:hypothetical protein
MRRLAPLLLIPVLVVSLAACSATSSGRIAASVGGEELKQSDLDDMLQSQLLLENEDVTIVDGQMPASTARAWAGYWVQFTGLAQVASFEPVDVDAAKATFAEQLGESWSDAPVVLQDLIVLASQVNAAVESGEIDTAAIAEAGELDVTVDSRLGTWDAENSAITPLGS